MAKWWLVCFFLIACAGSSEEDNAGVTSTGNAGEVAGIVVVEATTPLSKIVADSLGRIDSVLVTLYDINRMIVDSMRTNREGNFWFRNISPGEYYVHAGLADQIAEYEVMVEKGHQSTLEMSFAGNSRQLQEGEVVVGLYSALPGRVWQRAFLQYEYDTTVEEISVVRRNIETEDSLTGNWMVSFFGLEMNLRNPDQGTCSADHRFFSTMPEEVVDNNWYYNGDLAVDYTGEDYCSKSLETMPEMESLGMSGLEMQFGVRQDLKVAFYDREWCLSEAVNLQAVYGKNLPEGSTMEILDCSSFLVTTGTEEQTKVRVLWFDPAFSEGIEEIQNNGQSCVRRGPLVEFRMDMCK